MTRTEDFAAAFERALAYAERERLPALLDIRYDADGIAPGQTLSAIRDAALARQAAPSTPEPQRPTMSNSPVRQRQPAVAVPDGPGPDRRHRQGRHRRLALTALDGQGRDLVTGWMRDAGMRVRVDQLGNIFARRAGRDDTLPPVMTGSHIDTQPTGGKFDGCYGVLAGLEVIRTLNDAGVQTEAPLEVAI